jgi:Thioredoxin like C-terminal domain
VVLERAGVSIAHRFHARDAHLVLAGSTPDPPDPIPFRLLLDGAAPGLAHGADVDEDGHGLLTGGRLYQLVRQGGAVRERTLEITFLEPGAGRTRSPSADPGRHRGRRHGEIDRSPPA